MWGQEGFDLLDSFNRHFASLKHHPTLTNYPSQSPHHVAVAGLPLKWAPPPL
jgi:hypothetical protein